MRYTVSREDDDIKETRQQICRKSRARICSSAPPISKHHATETKRKILRKWPTNLSERVQIMQRYDRCGKSALDDSSVDASHLATWLQNRKAIEIMAQIVPDSVDDITDASIEAVERIKNGDCLSDISCEMHIPMTSLTAWRAAIEATSSLCRGDDNHDYPREQHFSPKRETVSPETTIPSQVPHPFHHLHIEERDVLESRTVAAPDASRPLSKRQKHSNRFNRSWIDVRLRGNPCTCARCQYLKPPPRRQTFRCTVATNAPMSTICGKKFGTNTQLVVHQLEAHQTLFPLAQLQRIRMMQHKDSLERAAPPMTVYIFQQWDMPIVAPDRAIDIDAEKIRILARGVPAMETRRKSREKWLYDVFMEACGRWQAGNDDERQSQYEEAFEFYARTKVNNYYRAENSRQWKMVGPGLNWLTKAT